MDIKADVDADAKETREEGRTSSLTETAKKMLDKKMKIEDIIEITRLPKEHINKLL